MRDAVSGAPVPANFPYANTINVLGVEKNFPPCLIGAIKFNETGLGQGIRTNWVISGDGGHGIMQLTSSYPALWFWPKMNIAYAIDDYLIPAWEYWEGRGLTGVDLVKCIAATYNAGLANALAGFNAGNVDLYTTNNYGTRAVEAYQALVAGNLPS